MIKRKTWIWYNWMSFSSQAGAANNCCSRQTDRTFANYIVLITTKLVFRLAFRCYYLFFSYELIEWNGICSYAWKHILQQTKHTNVNEKQKQPTEQDKNLRKSGISAAMSFGSTVSHTLRINSCASSNVNAAPAFEHIWDLQNNCNINLFLCTSCWSRCIRVCNRMSFQTTFLFKRNTKHQINFDNWNMYKSINRYLPALTKTLFNARKPKS